MFLHGKSFVRDFSLAKTQTKTLNYLLETKRINEYSLWLRTARQLIDPQRRIFINIIPDPAKGTPRGEGGGKTKDRKVARARVHIFRISLSRFSGSEEKRRNGERGRKNGERKTRVNLQAGSCREKAGSLSHAATTTGLQKQSTPHLLRWFAAPTNSPLSLCVFV